MHMNLDGHRLDCSRCHPPPNGLGHYNTRYHLYHYLSQIRPPLHIKVQCLPDAHDDAEQNHRHHTARIGVEFAPE